MKKSTKILLMLALVFAISGTAFGIVSFSCGFKLSDFETAWSDGTFRFVGPDRWREDIERFVSDASSGNHAAQEEYDEVFTGIEELRMDIGIADCTIVVSEEDTWRVIGYDLPSYFRCGADGNTLEISFEKRFWNFFDFFSDKRLDTELEIWIPKDQLVKEMKLNAGVGNLRTSGGALRCEKMELDSGVGDCTLELDITEKLDIDGGVGNIELELSGREEDFDYDVDSGVGFVKIGGQEYSDLGSETDINNGADKEIQVDSGVGDVEIRFTKE